MVGEGNSGNSLTTSSSAPMEGSNSNKRGEEMVRGRGGHGGHRGGGRRGRGGGYPGGDRQNSGYRPDNQRSYNNKSRGGGGGGGPKYVPKNPPDENAIAKKIFMYYIFE